MSNHWIHNIEKKYFPRIIQAKIIGSTNINSRVIRRIKPADKIMISTRNKGKIRSEVMLVGCAEVENIIRDAATKVGYDKCRTKLKLTNIILFKSALSLSVHMRKLRTSVGKANFKRTDYSRVTHVDFNKIIDLVVPQTNIESFAVNSSKTVQYSLNDDLFRASLNLIRVTRPDLQLIQISQYLNLVTQFAKIMGLNTDEEIIRKFYAHNAWKLSFQHEPTRNSDQFVTLFDAQGRPYNFGYIKLRGQR
ncbi:MAG: hypothetical protein ACRD38_11935 [Nitrososphaerales archaeon]